MPTEPTSVFAADSNCSSLTPGEGLDCEDELPKTLLPRPEVMEEMPQPEVSRVNAPQTQTNAPTRAALVAACLIAPRSDPSLASCVPKAPKPLGQRRRLPVLSVTKPSTPSQPRPSALHDDAPG